MQIIFPVPKLVCGIFLSCYFYHISLNVLGQNLLIFMNNLLFQRLFLIDYILVIIDVFFSLLRTNLISLFNLVQYRISFNLSLFYVFYVRRHYFFILLYRWSESTVLIQIFDTQIFSRNYFINSDCGFKTTADILVKIFHAFFIF